MGWSLPRIPMAYLASVDTCCLFLAQVSLFRNVLQSSLSLSTFPSFNLATEVNGRGWTLSVCFLSFSPILYLFLTLVLSLFPPPSLTPCIPNFPISLPVPLHLWYLPSFVSSFMHAFPITLPLPLSLLTVPPLLYAFSSATTFLIFPTLLPTPIPISLLFSLAFLPPSPLLSLFPTHLSPCSQPVLCLWWGDHTARTISCGIPCLPRDTQFPVDR